MATMQDILAIVRRVEGDHPSWSWLTTLARRSARFRPACGIGLTHLRRGASVPKLGASANVTAADIATLSRGNNNVALASGSPVVLDINHLWVEVAVCRSPSPRRAH